MDNNKFLCIINSTCWKWNEKEQKYNIDICQSKDKYIKMLEKFR